MAAYLISSCIVVANTFDRVNNTDLPNEEILQQHLLYEAKTKANWVKFFFVVFIRLFRATLDIIVIVLFIKIVKFYVITKAKRLEYEGREFTDKHHMIKLWVIVLSYLYLYRTLYFAINTFIQYYPYVDENNYNIFNRNETYRVISQI